MHEPQINNPTVRQQGRRFLRWWRDELVALLPQGLRRQLQQSEQQLVVDFSEQGVVITECRRGHAGVVLTLTAGSTDELSVDEQQRLSGLLQHSANSVVLRLPSEQVLSLSFSLPLEAHKNLHEVLGYELGRHAPFKVEQVYYDYSVLEQRGDEQKIWLSVVVVPRNQVEPMLTTLRAWGLSPDIITVNEPSPDGTVSCSISRLNLLPAAEREREKSPLNLAARVLMLSALLLVATLVAYPLLLQEMRIAELQDRVAALRSEAANVQTMQQELERAATESAFVTERKQQLPEVLDVLNILTQVLPDDTWLERFEMKARRIRIQGLSADASSLIELLENTYLLHDVTFDSPVVRDPRVERFRFQIVAELSARDDK